MKKKTPLWKVISGVLFDIFIGQWTMHSVHCQCEKCWPWIWEERRRIAAERQPPEYHI
jgi:hypothetical protein